MTGHDLSGTANGAPSTQDDDDDVLQAARVFRQALEAMADPGAIVTLPDCPAPAPLSPAAGALVVALADETTPIHLAGGHNTRAVRGWLRERLGAKLVTAQEAELAIGTWESLSPVGRFGTGSADAPESSATLIVELDMLKPEGALLLGADGAERPLSLPETDAFVENAALSPLGLDFFLTSGTLMAALPRGAQVRRD